MSPDPSELTYADPTNPQSLNLYAYVTNRPTTYVDPSGLWFQRHCGDQGASPAGTDGNSFVNGLNRATDAIASFFGCGSSGPGSDGGPDLLQRSRLEQPSTSVTHSISPPLGIAPTNPYPNCKEVIDPFFSGIDLKFKFGPAVELGPLDVGINMFTKTLGEEGVGSSVDLGIKGIVSVQGTKENAWAGGPPLNWSATVAGVNKDLNTPFFSSRGWKFQPSKEFRFGLQAIVGAEVGWDSDRYDERIKKNRACGVFE